MANTRTYQHRAADGSITFSDFPIRGGNAHRQSYNDFTKPASVVNACNGLSAGQLAERGDQLNAHFLAASREFGIDAALIKAVARAESCFDPQAVSVAGARGLMQLMPPTAKELGVRDIHALEENLRAGAQYLSHMLNRYANDMDLALAAYNAGPGNVDKYNGVPPFPETQRYIRTVRKFQDLYSSLSPPGSAAL